MDSLIHYSMFDAVRLLEAWSYRTRSSIAFTFAPRNPLLVAMRSVGRLFPSSNRAPWIEPMSEVELRAMVKRSTGLADWHSGRTQRISSGFYTSQALEVVR
jgi:magnesium-protoporphyrin O-methyltransferase